MHNYLAVAAGAGLGGLVRYVLATAIMARYLGKFPLGTFIINVSGSFLIGLLMTLLTQRLDPNPLWRLFLVVGVLGGYTTFSSFEYEIYQSFRGGEVWIGLLYTAGSVIAGYLAVWLGASLIGRP